MGETQLPEYQAVFFDFDGVLIDSEPLHYQAWAQALAPLGITVSEDVYLERFTGIEDRAAIEWLASVQEPPRPFAELWATFPAKQQVFLKRILAEPLMPSETCKLLEELKLAGYIVAVVSSSSSCELWPALERNGVRHLIDLGVFAEDVQQKKPNPEPYLKAKTLANVEQVLVLEDSAAGMASATAAGCQVLQVRDVEKVAAQVREHLGMS